MAVAASLITGVPDPGERLLPQFRKNDTPVDRLSAYSSGPGVVVADPQSTSALKELAAGVGHWLELTVASQSEFGQFMGLGHIRRASFSLGKHDLAFATTQLPDLYRILGANRAAIGTLATRGSQYTLTYQLYALPSKRRIGGVLRISGTRDAIVGQLPSLARSMVSLLGGQASHVPTAVGLSADDLVSMLALNPSPTQDAHIRDLARSSVFAAEMYLASYTYHTQSDIRAAEASIFRLAPADPQATYIIALTDPDALSLYPRQVQLDHSRYPHNYLFAETDLALARDENDLLGERKAAESGVRCAPRSPYSWLELCWVITREASAARLGRYIGDMTPAELTYVTNAYPEAVKCARRATELDPKSGEAWYMLATSATEDGDPSAADAFWKAYQYQPDKAETLEWGLEMFQFKWGGDAATLARVEHIAANYVDDTTAREMVQLSQSIAYGGGGTKADGDALIQKWAAKLQARIDKSPTDGQLHWSMATADALTNDHNGAQKEYAAALKLLPWRADLHAELAEEYDRLNQIDSAIREYQAALALDPASNCRPELAWDLNKIGQRSRSLAELQASLKDCAASPAVYADIGRIYAQTNDWPHAIPALLQATRLNPTVYMATTTLVLGLDETGRYTEALRYAKFGLLMDQRNEQIVDNSADIYLNLHKPEDSINLSNYAIQLNANDALAHENLGEAYIQLGRKNDARAEWQKVLTLGDKGIADVAQKMLAKYP